MCLPMALLDNFIAVGYQWTKEWVLESESALLNQFFKMNSKWTFKRTCYICL